MQAVAETLFDVVYLVSVIAIGIRMIRGSRGDRQFLCSAGWPWCWEVPSGSPGAGFMHHRAGKLYCPPWGLESWITSVTMTVFYVLLYYVWRLRYRVLGRNPHGGCMVWQDSGSLYA